MVFGEDEIPIAPAFVNIANTTAPARYFVDLHGAIATSAAKNVIEARAANPAIRFQYGVKFREIDTIARKCPQAPAIVIKERRAENAKQMLRLTGRCTTLSAMFASDSMSSITCCS